jgi:hypothetical protein
MVNMAVYTATFPGGDLTSAPVDVNAIDELYSYICSL